MDKIILILGERTEEIAKMLRADYAHSVEVVRTFEKPSDFHKYYEETPERVQRIIISEGSFDHAKHLELSLLKETFERFYVDFDKCYFLTSNNPETLELLKMLQENETFPHGHKLNVFSHERYVPKMVIEYALDKIPKKHFVKDEAEFEQIVRKRRDGETTFKLTDEIEEESDLVVLDRDSIQIKQLQQKLKNLNSLSNIVRGEEWENNRILKDILRVEDMMRIAKTEKKFEIDYSQFELKDKIRTLTDNIIIVTGERRSGKSTMAYSIAKSASNIKKVLLIDFDVKNLGLSYLAESVGDYSTVMLLQSFKHDFKNAVNTMLRQNTSLNVIVGNTKTLKELEGLNPINFISLIVITFLKYFDKIIFDIPLTSLEKIIPLFKRSEKVVLTIPTRLDNVISTVSLVKESGMFYDLLEKDLTVIPVDIYNDIRGSRKLKKRHITELLNQIYSDKIDVLTEIQIKSFNLDQNLYKMIDMKRGLLN